MAKQKTGVRFTYRPRSENDGGGLLLEQLRYAQLIRTEEQEDGSVAVIMLPPHGLDSARWAKMNMERLHSHRFMDAMMVVI